MSIAARRGKLAHERGHRLDIIAPKLRSKADWEAMVKVFGLGDRPSLPYVRHDGLEWELITARSPIGTKHAMESLAYYHRREFGFDFPCYTAGDLEGEFSRDHHFLIRTDSYDPHAVGAIGFRWRKWKDHPEGYALAWVWFHPYYRRQGILSALWPWFREHFGDFKVERPLSDAMNSFLAKQGEQACH